MFKPSLDLGLTSNDVRNLVNKMNWTAKKFNLGNEMNDKTNTMKVSYSFARDGGAVGDISLKDADLVAATLPINAIIRCVLIEVVTSPTSGGAATLALKSESAADLKGATAVASFTGNLDGVPVNSAATLVKLTAARTLYLSVAVAALTAGKFNVYIDWVQGG